MTADGLALMFGELPAPEGEHLHAPQGQSRPVALTRPVSSNMTAAASLWATTAPTTGR